MTRVLITGSRTFDCVPLAKKVLKKLLVRYENVEIIEGGAKGVDLSFRKACEEMNVPFKEFLADWDRYGRKAGILRNLEMIDEKPNFIIGLSLNIQSSKGTAHCMLEGFRRGIEVYLIDNTQGEVKVFHPGMVE